MIIFSSIQGQSKLTIPLDEHNADDDLTTISDDDTNRSDEHDNEKTSFTLTKTKHPQFSVSGVPLNKLKQSNNARKNPILTLTSLNADQYQSQGGNGVSVTEDWKLKLKPPIHMDGYVESPQVYKVNTLTHTEDQNAEDYLLHHRKNGPVSERLSSPDLNAEDLNAEGLNSDGLNAEGLNAGELNSQGLTSEGKISDGLSVGGLHSGSLTSGRMSLEGLNPDRLASEGMRSRYGNLHTGEMSFTPTSNTFNSIDRLLKSDEAHVGGDVSVTRTVTPNPYDKVIKQDISDLESALSNAEGQIPGEGRLSGIGSPVIHQGLTASLRSPEVEKESQINLAELQAPRGMVARVSPEIPPDVLGDSEGGRYVPLDSVIDDLRAHIGENQLNDNLALP